MITMTLKNSEARLVRRLTKSHKNVLTSYLKRGYDMSPSERNGYEKELATANATLKTLDTFITT